MRIFGVSAGGHDASISVVEDGRILFAAHSERYSRVKNDPELHSQLVVEALKFGKPDLIAWYEKPWKRKYRYIKAEQWDDFWGDPHPKEMLGRFGLGDIKMETFDHHLSHAAAGYYTSGFADASILVIDAIGEMNTLTIWQAEGTKIKKRYAANYPHSIGLFYSAFTQRCGLKPNEEEYILMGMAAYGVPRYTETILEDFFSKWSPPDFELKHDVHRGCKWWRPELDSQQDLFDIAASVQEITEHFVAGTAAWIAKSFPSRNLVYMGGVALNCVANARIARMGPIGGTTSRAFDSIWIMPNPGDAGSSLGAAALAQGGPLEWVSPYLGTDIAGGYPVSSLLPTLLQGHVVGVARGRAEYGPRALGNRSLLADPRGLVMKDRVNAIKKRERFRPFAPVIMEEHANRYFDMPTQATPYMQFVARCREPEEFPAIVHHDGTSRVQTVNFDQHNGLYCLLQEFYAHTGCPMLLNTSLNVKGQPLVDTWDHAVEFMRNYHVRVY